MEKLGTIYNTNRVRITLKVLKSSVPLASPLVNLVLLKKNMIFSKAGTAHPFVSTISE